MRAGRHLRAFFAASRRYHRSRTGPCYTGDRSISARRVRNESCARVKRYSGKVRNGKVEVKVKDSTVLGTSPLRCLDFATPAFGWGFHGSASEELAIAILHDHFGVKGTSFEGRVLKLYRSFTSDVIAQFENGEPFSLSEHAVARWITTKTR